MKNSAQQLKDIFDDQGMSAAFRQGYYEGFLASLCDRFPEVEKEVAWRVKYRKENS